MDKLELKHIAPYLPYKLKAFSSEYNTYINIIGAEEDLIMPGETFSSEGWFDRISIDKCKPILHPMSDLVRPCLQDGNIPLFELCKLTLKEMRSANEFLSDKCIYVVKIDNGNVFGYDDNTKSFFAGIDDKACSPVNQLYLFQWFYENHFDVLGLIGKKLAIDINTLNK